MNFRKKIAFISVINTLVLLWLSNYSGSFQAALLVAFIFFIGAFWVVKFDVLPIGFTTVLAFPSIIIFMFGLFYFVLPFSGFIKGAYLTGFLILNYVLFLNANIINVASMKKIALVQLSQTLSLILVIATIAISVLTFEVVKVSPIFFYQLVAILGAYLMLNVLLINEARIKTAIFFTLINISILLTLSIAFSIFEIPYRIFAMSVCILAYLLLSNQIERKNSLINYLESPFLIILISAVIFFFSINK